jgi:DNA-binding NarL/FixJ family response regulator
VAAVRAELGEEAFARAWTDGQALPLEQAIAYALEAGSRVPGPESQLVLADAGRGTPEARSDTRDAASSLTPREREVAALIARGHTNNEIAEALVLSVRTVERHIENIYEKIGTHGKAARTAVAAFALRQGLVEPE